MPKTNLELAQQTEEKFYFYMTALVFTMLGLSIQTAKFGNSKVSDVFELMGWVSFLLSGLAALYRIELAPNLYASADGLNKLKNRKVEVLQLKKQGDKIVSFLEENTPDNIDEYLKDLSNKISTLDSHMKITMDSLYRRYLFHRWTLIVGLLFIITARAYLPVVNLINCN